MKNIFLVIILFIPIIGLTKTSKENRADKIAEFTVQMASQDYRLPNLAVAGMYFINPNNLIGLKLGGHRGKENQDSVAIQYKFYFSNSFYIAPELFYLRSYEKAYGIIGNLLKIEKYATYTSLGAGFRLGNQWTWENLTLGCDWVGLGQRFGIFRKYSSKLNDTTFTLLNVIIGWSF